MGRKAAPQPLSLRAYARHREAAGLAGGTLRAVQVAIRDRRLVKSLTPDGKIASAEKADAEWAATTQVDRIPITGPTAAGAAPPDLQESRARREAAEAALAEIELAEKRAELVPAADVASKVAGVFSRCRNKLLGVPSRVRQRDPGLTPAQVDLFESAIREALEELGGKADEEAA